MGGSLFFKSGECVQEKVCYYKSVSTHSNGCHAYSVTVTDGQRNLIKYSSACSCGDLTHYICVDPNRCVIGISNLNMSDNIGSSNPTYDIDHAEPRSFLDFSLFAKNLVRYNLVFSSYKGSDFKIANSNFIRNKGQPQFDKLLWCDASTIVENCCFSENSCDVMFHDASGCVMNIICCYYDDNSTGSLDAGEVKVLSSKEINSTVSMRQIYIDECQKGKKFLFY